MIHSMKFNIFMGTAVRVLLALLFLLFDRLDPFIREIHQEEVWLYRYPVSRSYVPGFVLWLIIVASPFTVFSVDFLFAHNIRDLVQAIKAITFSYQVNAVITVLFKVLIGRPRPDFYYRCFPDGVGDDFSKCTGDRHLYMDGRKSFPSGHASFAFSCMAFLSLYLARRLNLSRSETGVSWKIFVCIFPLVISSCIAISRTCDYHHHYEDVIAGSILGSSISYLVFNTYFPKLREQEFHQLSHNNI